MRAIGKFVLQTGRERFPLKSISGVERSAWFAKENDEGCWMGLSTSAANGQAPQWIIFTAKDILYVAPITDPKITPPRQGRWELGDVGAAPAPTVNLQPLPAAFRLSGWQGQYDRLNGEYLPLDDGTELLNGRPIFTHASAMGMWAHKDKWRMYWSQGAWRIGDKNKLKTDQVQCIVFFESDVTHPTAKPGVVWKDMANAHDCGKDQNDSHFGEGISMATGAVRGSCWDFSGRNVHGVTTGASLPHSLPRSLTYSLTHSLTFSFSTLSESTCQGSPVKPSVCVMTVCLLCSP